MKTMMALMAALAFTGCAGGSAGPSSGAADPAPEPAANESGSSGDNGLVQPGHGTLRQDEITVQFRQGPLLIKVTPLSEAVTRLTAPDTYQRLHALAESRRGDFLARTGRAPELFLVSFFSYEPDIEFQPESLELTAQGRRLRAAQISPVTPGWGRQRLQQQETQTAVYAFDEPIDYFRSLTVEYGMQRSDAWNSILRDLEIERAKVRAREQ